MKHLEHFRSLKRFVRLTDIPTGAAEYNTLAFLSIIFFNTLKFEQNLKFENLSKLDF